MATEFKEVNGKQTQIVAVVVNGTWSKRFYRSNYNALSGVACIIRTKSKKIIYLGVRNKYFFCLQWAKHYRPRLLQKREWYFYCNGGVNYSGRRWRLNEAAPYGPTYTIKKLDCRNYLLRNYITKISELSKKSKFSITIRKQITSSDILARLRNAVTKAIVYRNNITEPLYMQIELLKKRH